MKTKKKTTPQSHSWLVCDDIAGFGIALFRIVLQISQLRLEYNSNTQINFDPKKYHKLPSVRILKTSFHFTEQQVVI